ncbi:dnaJ homolog subfamily C member 4-like [Harpegnathos saltator]|uniref:dnaJ homolog subfamily C member 4-like n=1 Tax=Harpegnathos saltator TaxID=610380 RepID=UPI00058BF89F|nr:dnaJ homolog subfamily C member 4-like [Harpegnathos saltator]
MSQSFRVCQSKICFVARSYSSQRYQQNHYETLKVPHNASQKDIKQAFFKLSKQLHPDTSGRYSHTDFVKLNEAYSVLGKANTRRRYDQSLDMMKYTYNPYTHDYSHNRQYGSRWEYEVRTAGGQWPPPEQKSKPAIGLVIALLFFGMGLFQLFFMLHSMKVRKLNQLRSMRLEHQYKKMQRVVYNQKNNIDQLDATNFDKFVTEDNSKY